jgi:hypothetical protein
MILMSKDIQIKVTNIKKSKDRKYIFETCENIIESLFEYDCASNLKFNKDDNSFNIDFVLQICKSGDMLWILLKEWLVTILESEQYVDVEITEREQSGIGIVYKMYRYTPLHQEIE